MCIWPPDDPDPFISLLLIILLCGLFLFYDCKCHICLPIFVHGLWVWLMILTLFAQLIYVNVLHLDGGTLLLWLLVNEGIGIILVIQTFYPSTLSVLYNKDVYPTSSIVWWTTFPFNIFKSHYTTQNTIISFIFSIRFYFTDIKIYIYLCRLLLLSCFGCSQYILSLNIIPSSFYHNHTI